MPTFPATLAASVLPSGKTLCLDFYDGSSAPTNLLAISTTTTVEVAVTGAGGLFTLTFGGQTTGGLVRAATAAAVQAALEALSSVGTGNVQVTGPPGGPWRVVFVGALSAPQALITVTGSGLTSSLALPALTAGTTGFIDHDDATVVTGSWPGQPYGNDGNHRERAATGDSQSYLTWTFTGLTVGWYMVKALWTHQPAHTDSEYAPSAVYRVLDGTTYRGAYRFDQRLTAEADEPSTGQQAVRAVYCASGTLSVVLADDTTGVISADVVSVYPFDPSAPSVGQDTVIGSYVGSWGAIGGGSGGVYHATALGTATANDAATLAVGGLPAGSYDVLTTWTESGTRSTQARYRVYDGNGSSPVLDVTVDQTAAPAADYTVGGRSFQKLGTVTPATGRIRLLLTAPDSATATLSSDALAAAPVALAALAETASAVSQFVTSGRPPQVTVNGSPVTLGTPVLHTPGSPGEADSLPYVTYPMGTQAQPGDVVLVTVDDGTFAAEAGPVRGVTATTLAQAVSDTAAFPSVPAARTMKVGFNFNVPSGAGPAVYANLMKESGEWSWSGGGAQPFTLDSNGYPVFSGAGNAHCVVRGSVGNPVDPKGYPNGTFGHHAVVYDSDGTGSVPDLQGNTGVTATLVSSDTGHSTDNVLVYDLQPDNAVTPLPYMSGFTLFLNTTTAGKPASNIRVYDPAYSSAWQSAPKFHANFLRSLADAKCIRFIGAAGGNVSSISDVSDYPGQSQRTYAVDDRKRTFTLVSIGVYADPHSYGGPNQIPMLVTLDRPHGLNSGVIGVFYPPGTGSEPDTIRVHATNGYTDLENLPRALYYDSDSMTTSQVAIANNGTAGKSPVATTYTGGGRVEVSGAAIPVADWIDLVNAVPGCDLWACLPHCLTDAAVSSIAAQVASNLAAGRKFYLECSNEHWNTNFSQYDYFVTLGQQLTEPGSATAGYAARASHFHTLAASAMGVHASDLVRVFGSFAVMSSVTQEIVDHTTSLDALAIANYTNLNPYRETSYAAASGGLDADQCLDIFGRYLKEERNRVRQCDPHWAVLHGAFPLAKLVDYEGAFSAAGVGGTDTQYSTQSQAVYHHPRFYDLYTAFLGSLQRGHVSLHNHYAHTHQFIQEGANPSVLYGAFQGYDTRVGKNDGTDPGGYDVRSDLTSTGRADLSRANSPLAAAVRDWNRAATSAASVTVTQAARIPSRSAPRRARCVDTGR